MRLKQAHRVVNVGILNIKNSLKTHLIPIIIQITDIVYKCNLSLLGKGFN